MPAVGQAAGQTSAADHKALPHAAETGVDPTQPEVASLPPLEQVATSATPTPTAVATAAPVTATHTAQPATATEQVAPTLLALAKGADGTQQMTVRLQPVELGMVQVKIARAASGATQVEISAENPSTLLALQRDQPQLHKTLDDAGIPAAGRSVTFHVAQAAQSAASGSGSGSSGGHAGGQNGSSGRTNAGTTDADGSSGSGRGSYPARERNTYSTSRRSSAVPAAATTAATVGTSYRVGLDITA